MWQRRKVLMGEQAWPPSVFNGSSHQTCLFTLQWHVNLDMCQAWHKQYFNFQLSLKFLPFYQDCSHSEPQKPQQNNKPITLTSSKMWWWRFGSQVVKSSCAMFPADMVLVHLKTAYLTTRTVLPLKQMKMKMVTELQWGAMKKWRPCCPM